MATLRDGGASVSNQTATVNRVTLLESIEAAENRALSVLAFHDGQISVDVSSELEHAVWRLKRAAVRHRNEMAAAELEAWGDGP